MGSFSTMGNVSLPVPASIQVSRQPRVRARHITPEAGHALEILGHAIEYLADEFAHEGGPLLGNDGRLDAVQLLMGVNRQIYFECPEVPTIGERFRGLLHLRTA